MWPEIDIIFKEELVGCVESGCPSGIPHFPV